MSKVFTKIGNENIEVDPMATWPLRIFRDVWVRSGPVIDINMTLAKEVAKKIIRRERQTHMIVLDAKWMQAMGTGDQSTIDSVEGKRQQLRNAPQDPRLNATEPPDLVTAINAIIADMEAIANG